MQETPIPPSLRRLVLRVPNRRRLYEAIVAAPGTHARRLVRELGMARGVVAHHLAQLEKHGLVFHHQAGRRRTLFAAGQIGPEAVGLIHLLRKPELAVLLDALVVQDGCGVIHLATRIGAAPANVSYRLRRLRDAGLVERFQVGREAIYVVRAPQRVRLWLDQLRPQHAGPAPDGALAGVVARAGDQTEQPRARLDEPPRLLVRTPDQTRKGSA